MPKPAQRGEINTFVKGLITEANPLSVPENCSIDEQNFVLHANGKRTRRLGLDIENDKWFNGVPYGSYVWGNPGGDVTREFLVVYTGMSGDKVQLAIFDNLIDKVGTKDPIWTASLTLQYEADMPSEQRTVLRYLSCCEVQGYLIVVAGKESFYCIDYNKSTGKFELFENRLLVRDHWGLPTNTQADTDYLFRPSHNKNTSLDNAQSEHMYNLENQSWAFPRRDKNKKQLSPIKIFNDFYNKLPSNSESVWLAMKYQAASGENEEPFERLYPEFWDDSRDGNAPVAKGYFILDWFKRGQSRVRALQQHRRNHSTAPQYPLSSFSNSDYSDGYIGCVAAYAGRAIFSGFITENEVRTKTTPFLNNAILFSQTVENRSNINKCYSSGDPTSRDASDIVATDGGVIFLDEARNIRRMVPVGNALFIFAENGVWALTGTEDTGFTATGYVITKLSTTGLISHDALVETGDAIVFMSEDAINLLYKNQMADNSVEDISATTIRSFYVNIPLDIRRNVKGYFDRFDNKVRFVYHYGDIATEGSEAHELILDLSLKAWYRNKIYKPERYPVTLAGIYRGKAYQLITEDMQVVPNKHFRETKYIVCRREVNDSRNKLGRYKFAFARYNNPYFRDFSSYDGVGKDAEAYLVTGTSTFGDSAVKKWLPYLVMHFERTENRWLIEKQEGSKRKEYPVAYVPDVDMAPQLAIYEQDYKTIKKDYLEEAGGVFSDASEQFDKDFDYEKGEVLLEPSTPEAIQGYEKYLNSLGLGDMNPFMYWVFIGEDVEEEITKKEIDHLSACWIRSQWDWANSSRSNKWSPFFQAYRYVKPIIPDSVGNPKHDNGFEVVTTKNKIRGIGRSFCFMMKTEPFKDCRILGWSMYFAGNQY